MKLFKLLFLGLIPLLFFSCGSITIDREEFISSYNVKIQEIDTLNSLSIGNGRSAITVDFTGLQTFPEIYKKGMSLGQLSEWAWHSFPTEEKYSIETALVNLDWHGRKIPYARQFSKGDQRNIASNYIRQNPHRIHLGSIRWIVDGEEIDIKSIENIQQELDLWKGQIISQFELKGTKVKVLSTYSQEKDQLIVQVKSNLLKDQRLGVEIRYPYPTDEFLDEAALFEKNELIRLNLEKNTHRNFFIRRELDETIYWTNLQSNLNLTDKIQSTGILFIPKNQAEEWEFGVEYDSDKPENENDNFQELINSVEKDYQEFWENTGLIKIDGKGDPRAKELERREILSLYLLKVHNSGNFPPQETGYVSNSWFGKPHMEMIWWHSTPFALYNQGTTLKNQLNWYKIAKENANKIASRQGFKGYRWQKMTDNAGQETASSVGSYLIWQQPHPIYFLETLFQIEKDSSLLNEYEDIIIGTADFMASFAWYDIEKDQYILGPGIIPAQERFDPVSTINPTYELAYWKWALGKAIEWEKRLGKVAPKEWLEVANKLSPLPIKDNLYLFTENAKDSYSNKRYHTDHPAVLGTFGMLPKTSCLDEKIMLNTYHKIKDIWVWEDTWGWDFPMAAMTASRLGLKEEAVNVLLMPIITNTFLKNGHNYQTERLRLYLPGNGGFLTALAMMTNGWIGSKEKHPGIPENWEVKIENMKKGF